MPLNKETKLKKLLEWAYFLKTVYGKNTECFKRDSLLTKYSDQSIEIDSDNI